MTMSSPSRSPEAVAHAAGQAQAMRAAAARLLAQAHELDARRFYAVTHSHSRGNDIYYGWFLRRPCTEQMAALVEAGGGRYTPGPEESLEPGESFASEYPGLCGSEMDAPLSPDRHPAGDAARVSCLLPAGAAIERDPQPAWARFVLDAPLLRRLHLAELMVQSGACSRMDVPVDGVWGPSGFNGNQITEMVVAVEATPLSGRVLCSVRGFNYQKYTDGPLLTRGQFTVSELRDVWRHAKPGAEKWLRSPPDPSCPGLPEAEADTDGVDTLDLPRA